MFNQNPLGNQNFNQNPGFFQNTNQNQPLQNALPPFMQQNQNQNFLPFNQQNQNQLNPLNNNQQYGQPNFLNQNQPTQNNMFQQNINPNANAQGQFNQTPNFLQNPLQNQQNSLNQNINFFNQQNKPPVFAQQGQNLNNVFNPNQPTAQFQQPNMQQQLQFQNPNLQLQQKPQMGINNPYAQGFYFPQLPNQQAQPIRYLNKTDLAQFYLSRVDRFQNCVLSLHNQFKDKAPKELDSQLKATIASFEKILLENSKYLIHFDDQLRTEEAIAQDLRKNIKKYNQQSIEINLDLKKMRQTLFHINQQTINANSVLNEISMFFHTLQAERKAIRLPIPHQEMINLINQFGTMLDDHLNELRDLKEILELKGQDDLLYFGQGFDYQEIIDILMETHKYYYKTFTNLEMLYTNFAQFKRRLMDRLRKQGKSETEIDLMMSQIKNHINQKQDNDDVKSDFITKEFGRISEKLDQHSKIQHKEAVFQGLESKHDGGLATGWNIKPKLLHQI